MARRWPPFALAATLVALDQLTKAWVVAEVPLGARVASWAGFLHLTHTRNSGAAFGLLRDRTLDLGVVTVDGVQLLGLVSLLVALLVAAWLLRSRTLTALTRLALGAIMGGAVGNGIDRWRLHYVTDFIHAQAGWFDFPVFNVADMGITVGAGALLLATLVDGRRHAGDAERPHGPGDPERVQDPGDAERPHGPGDAENGAPAVVSDAPARSASDR